MTTNKYTSHINTDISNETQTMNYENRKYNDNNNNKNAFMVPAVHAAAAAGCPAAAINTIHSTVLSS